MSELLSEAIGTFVLILFGCGVNAGISLKSSFSKRSEEHTSELQERQQ